MILAEDNSGHGMEHIERVLKLALRFGEKEGADKDIVALIALLHDVDDYKLQGISQAENLTNAKAIMKRVNIEMAVQNRVLTAIKQIGYSNTLKGIRPTSIEGKVVSDADMCDAIGVHGILRSFQYNLKKGCPFFNRFIFPSENLDAKQYMNQAASSSVCHFFEKLLKLKDIMMTTSGKQEAINRHQIMVDVLYQLFDEEDADDWKQYLSDYLDKLN